MEKKSFLFFIALLFVVKANAQTQFELVTGGTSDDLAGSIEPTNDGGYIIAGATQSFGNYVEGLAWKLSAQGNVQWAKTYGKFQYDRLCTAIQTSDGNYVFTGTVVDSLHVDSQSWVFKTDAMGNPLWSKTYGNAGDDYITTLRGIVETADSGFAFIGTTNYAGGTLNIDAFVIRTDKSGDTLWTKVLRGINSDQVSAIEQTADGGFILCGRTNSFGNFIMDAFLLKLGANGNVQWAKRYGNAVWDEATEVRQTNDLGFIVCGATTSFGSPDYDAMIFKTDSLGNMEWSTVVGNSVGYEALYGIVEASDGGFVAAGFAEGYSAHRYSSNNLMGNDSADVYILKLDALGDTVWNYVYGGHILDEAYYLSQHSDGGFIATGYSESFTADSSWKAYVVKTDSLGNSCTAVAIFPDVLHTVMVVDTITFIELNDIVVENYNMAVTNVLTSDSLFCFITTSLHEQQQNFDATLAPNPFSNTISIELNGAFDFKNVLVKVYDVMGRDVSDKFVIGKNSHHKISCEASSSLTPGFYLLEVFNGEKAVKTFKIIRE